MQDTGSLLNPEQKAVLGTTYHFIEGATIYFRSVLPIADEVDKRLLGALIELAESCLRCLPEHFPDLRTLAEDRKNRGGGR